MSVRSYVSEGPAASARARAGMAQSHPPRREQPPEVTLMPGARVRDAVTGETRSSEEWLAARAERERRTHDECVDELMNAVARGDLIVEGN